MKISQYILISFISILVLFSVTTFINYRLSNAVNSNAAYLSRSTIIVKDASRFQRNVINMVSGLRGYLLTGEKYYIESYDSADYENEAMLLELNSLITDSLQQRLLTDIRLLNQRWKDEYTEPLTNAKMQANVSDSNLREFNRVYKEKFQTGNEKEIQNALQQKLRDFANLEYRIRNDRKEQLSRSINRTRTASFSLTIISLIVAIIVVIFLIRKISRRISQMTNMADAIAKGHYKVHITDPGQDELSSLVHSLNHMADELSRNISLLKRSNEELDQFAHIASHDMKGPLRGISNVISWIEEDHKEELSPKVDEYIQIIKRRIMRAEGLIAGLLSYARIGKEETGSEYVILNDLIDEIFEDIATKEHIETRVEPLPVVYTERLLLYQVFSNLISNAIKYNDKEHIIVSIYHKAHTDYYEFFVADNGPGIAESYHTRIFAIFQTLNDRDSFESTGVGLAIVKKILDSKKQKVKVISTPGGGAVFTFTWPNNQNNETN